MSNEDISERISPSDLEQAALEEGYSIITIVGVGGFGEVYQVRDKGQNIRALKLLTVPKRWHPAIAHAYGMKHHDGIQESERYADTFRHPHIVQFHSSGILSHHEQHIGYIVSEYVEGITLEDAIKKSIISLAQKKQIISELTSAIAHIHEFGFIHNDIKPDNIKLDATRKQRVVVLDFSNAEEADPYGIALIETKSDSKRHPVLPSTRYRAPELDKGELPSFRSDVWSLGAVFYELLTSQNIKRQIETEQCSLQQLIKKNIPRKYRKVISKCLNEEPRKRYNNAGLVYRALLYADNYYVIRMGVGIAIPLTLGALLSLPFVALYTQHSFTSYYLHQCIDALDKKNEPEKAKEYCVQALQWDNSSSFSYLYLGHSLIELEEYEHAESAYRAAFIRDDDNNRNTTPEIQREIMVREIDLRNKNENKKADALKNIRNKIYTKK